MLLATVSPPKRVISLRRKSRTKAFITMYCTIEWRTLYSVQCTIVLYNLWLAMSNESCQFGVSRIQELPVRGRPDRALTVLHADINPMTTAQPGVVDLTRSAPGRAGSKSQDSWQLIKRITVQRDNLPCL